ncbi:TetR/AcrR family transcriptional regulator [Ruminococcus flavefaciens]|uniref:TetR family transcriptional regulator n=1 Tax=Ruminococcus flavefaciens TaxID=1265 RepID=A0A315XSQ2_RUMFL|nr:TetR/AcrR family transcriptional regulator [Ruminococcus flavefaciens]MBQ6170316.1 TetR/AcrR family transcriptional regulator [Ruminococcus sp.]PWJ09699.1 TetR family transcriptional regulator [Ruminococcus flavefaciens]SSA52264.1 transcriptional regulator, TetR family [Ruminococcus flavefaciens]
MENEISHDSLKNKRYEKAVEVSAQLFLKNGIDSVKMTDIADECGIGVATLYRWFGTKNGITIAAMTYMWNELNKMFSGIFESEVFLSQSGIKQLNDLMRMFIVLYEAHPGFMRLLSEFDLLLISEDIPKKDLKEYERSIINFYPVFENSYMMGIADGTVREIPDIRMFYLSFAHTLMELSKKLIQGELLPNDDFSHAEEELSMIIEAAVFFLKKE